MDAFCFAGLFPPEVKQRRTLDGAIAASFVLAIDRENGEQKTASLEIPLQTAARMSVFIN